MGANAADFPSILDPITTIEAVRMRFDMALEADGLLSLLGEPMLVAGTEMKVPQLENMRRTGEFTSAASVAKPIARTRKGVRYEAAVFQQLITQMPDDLQPAIHDIRQGRLDLSAATSQVIRARLEQWFDLEQDELVEVITRTLKLYMCNMLQASGAFSTEIDGAAVSENYGINTHTSTNAWNAAGTDQIQEYQKVLRVHRRAANAPPTHCILNSGLFAEIANNTEWLNFMYNQMMSFNPSPTPEEAFTFWLKKHNIEVIDVYDRTDVSGTQTDMWDLSLMAFLTIVPNGTSKDRVFVHGTPMRLANNMEGGMSIKRIVEDDPPAESLRVDDARFIGIAAPTKVTLFDLNF